MSRLLLVGSSAALVTACHPTINRDTQALPSAIQAVKLPAQPVPLDEESGFGLNKKAPLPEAPDGEVVINKCRHVTLQATGSNLKRSIMSSDGVSVEQNDDGSYTSQVGVVLTDNATYDESVTARYHCLFRGMPLIQNEQESEFKKNGFCT